jgi:glycerol-3-phosphate dehydrogenase (NAD(P)+)
MPTTSVRFAVIGAGSWGTGFAAHLGALGHSVRIYAREPEVVRGINDERMNPLFNTGAAITGDVRATGEIADALSGAEVAAVAIPSKYLTGAIDEIIAALPDGCIFLCLTKGFVGEPPELISEYVAKTVRTANGGASLDTRDWFAILSGPNLASEIALGLPTAAVVASASDKTARRIQSLVSGSTFRVYTSPDVVGVEVGGSVKNVIAIAAGVIEGFGLGVNARSVLITRGLVEMTRLALRLGARRETLAGLSGLGDLITTCSSRSSRNFTVGFRLTHGESLAEIEASMMMVAEGVTTTRAVHRIATELGIEMPITEQVKLILDDGKPIKRAIADLMNRDPKPEDAI